MPAPEAIRLLVDKFTLHRTAYQSGVYNETQIRREFIDPFFKALGWDIDNEQGYAEAYKDVVHEDSIKIGTLTKAPDYSFRIGGMRKFFVEAKKPSVNVGQDTAPAYQLRRYGWSAKLPLSILTDFEEFAVYDCRVTPFASDKASTARTLYLTFEQYVDRWEEIESVFSPNAIRKGSFDRYADSTKKKKGTAEVDDAFLAEIENWRSELARNLATRNADLTQRELNVAVQKTIDRIIFLRICEDRGIEPYGQLQGMANGTAVYRRLCELFRKADDRYNSGLFHFTKEKNRPEDHDEWTLSLLIDDRVLKEILRRLYYPESPYAFSVMPAEILGQVYEQFLGKVIRLTKGHQAKVEDKPEVKKAGGVYYTPAYIVSYIVKETLGKLLQGKEPHEIAGRTKSTWKPAKGTHPVTVLDPACGSGSFLIVAYQYLLDWYRDWYVANNPGKYKDRVYQTRNDQWRLTTAERKRILLDHVYGVDIDVQAVEVTKLSLLLKVLEGENQETLKRQLQLFRERALPDLANNIKCGNSLIGPDFYQSQQLDLFDADAQYRINAFDWQTEFQAIMKSGGFDAIIGNPPYGFHQIHSDAVKPYFKSSYAASEGSYEHYFLFYEASLRLIRQGGQHGFIVPVTWLTIPSAAALRKVVLGNFALRSIAWLPEMVFKNAQVNTLVSIIERGTPDETRILISEVNDPNEERGVVRNVKQSLFTQANNTILIFEDNADTQILKKIDECSKPLAEIARPCSGYNPYEVGSGIGLDGKPHTSETVETKPYHSATMRGQAWKPEAIGRDLGRYSLQWPTARFVKYGPWLAAARDPNNFQGPRILVQEITGGSARRLVATFCSQELFHSRDIIPIKCDSIWPMPQFLLGVINSWLLTWRHHRRSPKAKKALFPKVLVSDLKTMPIPHLDPTIEADCKKHDKMVELVNRMLALHQQLPQAKVSQAKTILERQIATTDRQIDQLVYDLYRLTDEEIRIVEGSNFE